MRIINKWGPGAQYRIAKVAGDEVADEGTILTNQVFLTLRLDARERYKVRVQYPPLSSSFFRFASFRDLTSKAEIELRLDNPFRAPAIKLETYYALFMGGDAQLFLSWRRQSRIWAYLYEEHKVLWFSSVSGTDGDELRTGVPIRVLEHTVLGATGKLAADAKLNVRWDTDTTSGTFTHWRVWREDQPGVAGLPVQLGQPIVLESVTFPGKVAYRSRQDPRYLLVGDRSAGTSSFQILPSVDPTLVDNYPLRGVPLTAEHEGGAS